MGSGLFGILKNIQSVQLRSLTKKSGNTRVWIMDRRTGLTVESLDGKALLHSVSAHLVHSLKTLYSEGLGQICGTSVLSDMCYVFDNMWCAARVCTQFVVGQGCVAPGAVGLEVRNAWEKPFYMAFLTFLRSPV